MTLDELVAALEDVRAHADTDGPVCVGLDHGGGWTTGHVTGVALTRKVLVLITGRVARKMTKDPRPEEHT